MKAAEHVLKYLSGSYTDGLYFGENLDQRKRLWGWVDADFAADIDSRRLHTGDVLMLNGRAVSWKSTNQTSVSLSTAEVEWYTTSEAGKEVVHVCMILSDYGFEQKAATQFYIDPRAVITMADNPVNRKGSRQIDTGNHLFLKTNACIIITHGNAQKE